MRRTTRSLLPVVCAAVAAALTACASSGYQPADDEDPDSFQAVKDIHGGPYTDMVLVYLKAGPKIAQQTREQSERVFAGHMANMKRLADAGQLLVAGPFERGHTRDTTRRGIFLLDTPNIQLARLQTGTDPGVQAGLFEPEYRQVKASIELRRTLELEKGLLAGARADKETPRDTATPPPNARAYVMATADDALAADAALRRAGLGDRIVWCARFSGKGPKGYGRGGVFVLDAQKVEDVQAALDKTGGAPGTGLDQWWSTPSLTGLSGSARVMPGR
ncbi:MAG: YciI family protein [Phycisphaerales bacterium]|nr:YciI family protein [Phycisphaerales bacterium]